VDKGSEAGSIGSIEAALGNSGTLLLSACGHGDTIYFLMLYIYFLIIDY
jgi:hypothetical protein